MDLLTRQDHHVDQTLQSLQMAIANHFSPLRDHEIRLIDIKPGKPSDSLCLRLYHATLGRPTSPHFEALSYVWGSPAEPIKIVVEVVLPDSTLRNDEFPIGRNLAAALQHLRYVDVPRTIWADAICINQEDYDERAKQVLMMHDIYHLARKVVAFLGPEQDDSDAAFEVLERIGGKVEVDFSSGIVTPLSSSVEPEWVDMKQQLHLEKREAVSLYNLIRQEWFERLWIRQEIGLGEHEGVLQCGRKQVQWRVFCKAIFVIFRKPLVVDGFDVAEWQNFQRCLGQADTVALYSKRRFRFSNLRRQIRTSKCSDPRDRIYGIMGQLRESDQITFMPDYTKSVVEIYTDVTKKYIQHFNMLEILNQCELRPSNLSLKLPSWVPDWSSNLLSSQVHAVLPAIFDLLPTVATIDDRLLRAHGIPCGTVSQVLHKYELQEDANPTEIIQALKKLLSEAEKMSLHENGETREHILEAYTHALWVGNFGDRWYPPVPHEPFYDNCLSIVRSLLNCDSLEQPFLQEENSKRGLGRAHDTCTNRALFITEDGHIGLGPASISAGDELGLIFSCSKPIALRPSSKTPHGEATEYKVVGECYLDRRMLGEALLGELPRYLSRLLNPDNVTKPGNWGFIDTRTNTILLEDPRIEPFLAGLVEKGLLPDPSIEKLEKREVFDVLVKAGYPLKIYNLV
ncbi:heterokaryon incompatibility protein-domain-containing protein [Annulohypoxylon maeteangense]|uniref:heterokaryon incompatibility protein-domain-containing protein n=1 Tax=Annulohypoxylon maeteangense TaxID=1927788 RepID=UPI002008E83A|nr:heterokaryon incompatibility protein-domain-containing protein [Annulohypoxylon maeteangense]KAI0881518.1 heterokaryon incompatibility protein-domain-containing protein [Annulohypoxylon maeteangense]